MPIVEINKLMICFAVKMHIQFFFSVIGEFRAEHLVNRLLVTFRNIFGNRLSIIATSANVAFRKAIHKTSYQTAATESRVVYHVFEHIRLTRKADAHIGLFQHYRFPCGSVADVGLAIPRFQQEAKIRDITQILFNNDFIT